MQPGPDDVLSAVGERPLSIGDLGLEIVRRRGGGLVDGAPAAEEGPPGDEMQPVGQRLAAASVSLSALQQLVDGLVAEARVVEVRGRDLWGRGLPTAGTKASGRYYLAAAP